MTTEVASHADFSAIRYAQCWEDADVLVAGLDVAPGDSCLSICSAGDNTLALLTRDPAMVLAVDLSRAQVACLEVRVAAFRALTHAELLELVGSRASDRRAALYARCRDAGLGDGAREFWDARRDDVARGIGACGRFEAYFRTFRRRVLPLIHGSDRVDSLLSSKSSDERREFYDRTWDNRRWRWLFALFFSRWVMARLGRDRAFFRYADGSPARAILSRTRHALRDLDPGANPYVHWILRERHSEALPLWLREEHFERIRRNIGRVRWHVGSIEDALDANPAVRFDRFNLSDVFEYMSADGAEALLRRIVGAANPGARLLYWNMMVFRERPGSLAGALRPLRELADSLHDEDKAFFYARLVIEEVVGRLP